MALTTSEVKPFVVVWENGSLTHNTSREISRMYDLSDCDYMDGVVAVYAADDNKELVKVRLGELRRENDPDNRSIVYAYSDIMAGEKMVGVVHWSDHLWKS